MKVYGAGAGGAVFIAGVVLARMKDKHVVIHCCKGDFVLKDFPFSIYHIYKIVLLHNSVGMGAAIGVVYVICGADLSLTAKGVGGHGSYFWFL